MMLSYSFNLNYEAKLIENAIAKCLENNIRTSDIFEEGSRLVSSKEMGDAILLELKNSVN